MATKRLDPKPASDSALNAGYSSQDVQRLLEISATQLRAFVTARFLTPARGERGRHLFTFQDIVLLRTAKGLIASKVSPARVRRALARLREQLPSDRPLTGVAISAEGDRVVVRDGASKWLPESGQAVFDFQVGDLARQVAPLPTKKTRKISEKDPQRGHEVDAEGWYGLGCELEPKQPERAREAYARALALDPRHADAHINLGRLLHEQGDAGSAMIHYQLALGARPGDAIAAFNLATALEDLGRGAEAIQAYLQAISADPECADAYFNVARLYERDGDERAAIRYLKTYRRLLRR